MECIFNISDYANSKKYIKYANSKKYIKIRYIIYVNNKPGIL